MVAADGVAFTNSYILESEDMIEVKVYREADLDTRTKLDRNGMVVLPLIGEVKIGGMTQRQARLLIAALYEKDYLVAPQVTLTVTPKEEESEGNFTVLGSVTTAGSFGLPKGKKKITLLEAIGLAGGFTRYANRNDVRVKRREGNRDRVYEINVKRMMDDAETEPFYIIPGDSINVPERIF